jgi:DNA-binding winged helix-turn-helix (wHTH) protein
MTGPISFGSFVLNPDARELSRAGHPVALSPKAYELLEILVANRPKALSKTALREQLWPDTFVVEKNLVNLIAEIREALGDNPTNARFIRTVPRFGYAFREAAAPIHVHVLWDNGRAALGNGDHVLGRDPDVEIFLDSPGVSRRHAMLRINGGEVTVEDLGSKNGTFVGDRRVGSPTRLLDGEVFSVGSVKFTIRTVRQPASTLTDARSTIETEINARSSADRGRRGRC